jgi:hypothetical protein
MSDQPQGPDWWQASDFKWYPPQPPAAPPTFQTPPSYQAPSFQAPSFQAPSYQAPPAYPIPPYPSAPKKSKAGWIIGGIFVVLLLGVGGCAALVFAVGDTVEEARANQATVVGSTVPGDPSAPAATGGAGSRQSPVEPGVAIDLGNGWTVKVDSADVSPGATAAVTGANPLNDQPPAGFRYITVAMTATFAGRSDAETESPTLGFSASVFGSAGVERNSYDAFVVPPDPQFDGIAELAGGGTASGNLAFQVGADETDLVLRVTSVLTFDDTETWIRLG